MSRTVARQPKSGTGRLSVRTETATSRRRIPSPALESALRDELRRAGGDLAEDVRSGVRAVSVPPESRQSDRTGAPSQVQLKACTDEDLAVRGAGGCETSWTILYERSYPCPTRYACDLGWGTEEAEDLAQETLVRAWEKRMDYNPAFSYRGWVRMILQRLSTDQHRRRGAWGRVEEKNALDGGAGYWCGESFGDTEKDVDGILLERHLEPVWREIPEEDRALLLEVEAGAKIVELAAAQGVNDSTMRGRIRKIRNRFESSYRRHYEAAV